MAYFQRVTFVFLFLLCGSVLASVPMSVQYYSGNGPGGASSHFVSPDALCSAAMASKQANNSSVTYYRKGTAGVGSPPTGGCWLGFMIGSQEYTESLSIDTLSQCPAGSSYTGTSCECSAPAVEDSSHTSCSVPSSGDLQCDASAVLENSTLGGGPGEVKLAGHVNSGSVCIPNTSGSGGCTADLDVQLRYGKGAGEVTLGVLTRLSGPKQSCALTGPIDPAKPPVAPSKPCPNGQPGTVNGTEVCVPFAPTTPVETTKTSKVDSQNPDGTPVSTQTNSTTICTGGSCTTSTVVTVNNNGTVTSSTTTTAAAKSDFCTQNPKDKQCGQMGAGAGQFGGACKAGFTCDGDAVMCALATEQHTRDCALFEDSSVEGDIYGAEKGKDGVQVKPDTVSIGPEKFDQTNLLGVSASCVADKQISINVSGHSFAASIPLSQVCPYLGWLGFANMACAFLVASMIVGRS